MRLGKLIIGDIRFQWKYGFYLIYVILTTFYVCVLGAIPETWRYHAKAIMIYSDPASMGLFFMGAIVLLEKNQKVLDAIAVSPVRVSEYILSKTAALVLISCIVAAVLEMAAGGGNLPAVLLGTAVTSAIFTMLGIMAATRIRSLNQFIIFILPIELVCFLPPIVNLFTELPGGLQFYPFIACMNLINGSSHWMALDLLQAVCLLLLLYPAALKLVSHMWQSIGGVKI